MRCRHAFGDQYQATDLVIPGAGKLELVFYPQDGGEPQRFNVHEFAGAGQPYSQAPASHLAVTMP